MAASFDRENFVRRHERVGRYAAVVMALSATRLEFRIALANIDRGVQLEETLIVAQHPSETAEHVTLRVLAWCLLNDERLELGPGLCDGDAADLWAHDLTGRLTTWVECGTADADKLRKVLLHQPGASAHAVLCDARRRDDLLAGIATWKKPPRAGELVVWTLDPSLVSALAATEDRRRSWTVTIVGGHAYIETAGAQLEAPIETLRPLES